MKRIKVKKMYLAIELKTADPKYMIISIGEYEDLKTYFTYYPIKSAIYTATFKEAARLVETWKECDNKKEVK